MTFSSAARSSNRIWAEFMGFGIVEPVDEFDLARYDPKNPPPAPWTIQPSNPELLDAMANDFPKNNYSFRHLVQNIMKSSAYQLSSRFEGEWKEEYAPYYARKYVRMLSARRNCTMPSCWRRPSPATAPERMTRTAW